MALRNQLTSEQSALVLTVLGDEATPDQVAELDQLLRSKPQLVDSVVNLVGQEAWLAWSSAAETSTKGEQDSGVLLPFGADRDRPHSLFGPAASGAFGPTRGKSMLAASLAILATGLLLGAVGMRGYQGMLANADLAPPRPVISAPKSDYSAQLVEMSTCLWSPTGRNVRVNNEVIRKGESFHLLEGLAQLQIANGQGRSILDIEGPAGVVLTADGGCNVTHGRVCADVKSLGEDFLIDTPTCLVSSSGSHSDLGVSVDGRRVEVHVFAGKAMVVVPWGLEQFDSLSSELQAGESLTLSPDADGKVSRTRTASDSRRFTARTSMRSNRLVIPDSYPRAVMSRDPLVYWRFDDVADSQSVRNWAGEQYMGIVHGKLARGRDGENGYLDFTGGVSEGELKAYVTTGEPLGDGIGATYSLEMWMKPSHFHHCSLVSFFLPEPDKTYKKKHGFLLELGGPTAMKFSLVEPGRVRYLHRSPPGGDVESGTACFSSVSYVVRRWQHVVAVKEQDKLKLYIDGQIVASADDRTPMPEGMVMLLGQLDDRRFMRRFVGQIDEVAFYPSAVSAAEVLEHYNLVQNAGIERRAATRADDI